jgi:hypothetical protein
MAEINRGRSINNEVSDINETHVLLREILEQLKIINIHFTEWDSMRVDERDLIDRHEP